MQWDSPWGKGYPGWHIECSAMGMKYIGETLDIHGGGLDNIFPHHECEIAQSEGITEKPFVKYFIHNNILTVNGTKMGKSLGNFIILKDLFKKIDPMVLRFYILQGHYRSPLDFTDNALEAAKNGYERLKKSIFSLRKAIENHKTNDKNDKFEDVNKLKKDFISSLDDDLNTSKSIAILYEILKISNNELSSNNPCLPKLSCINQIINDFACDILGFKFEQKTAQSNIEDKLVELLINIRNNVRKEKNFKLSDEIRDNLKSIGITLKDSADGTTFTK